MSRKSRKMEENVNNRGLLVAGYCRISVLDRDSYNSIKNQKENIKKYYRNLVKEGSGYCGLVFYEDVGVSGTSFFRDSFRKLLEDIEKGTISCVVVKDLSRLGRSSYDTMDYILNYFEKRKVRIISTDDMFDSDKYQRDINAYTRLAVSSIVNSFYAKDISKKVKAAYMIKRNSDQYLGGAVPYGFEPLCKNNGRLVIDMESMETVKGIFRMNKLKMSNRMIADKLNSAGVLPPREYYRKKYKGCKENKDRKWYKSSVQRILNNPLYTEYIDIN